MKCTVTKRLIFSSWLVLVFAVAGVTGMAGCHSGPRNFENDNDHLRREVMNLNSQVGQLTQELAALDKSLEAAEQRAAKEGQVSLPKGVRRPVCSSIAIARFSGGVDTNRDGHDDAIRVYLETRDSHQRFVQTIGQVQITVVAIDAGKEAVTVATQQVNAVALDQAYRNGPGGLHYTLVIPIPKPVPENIRSLTVRIALRDILNGHTLKTQAPLRWSP